MTRLARVAAPSATAVGGRSSGTSRRARTHDGWWALVFVGPLVGGIGVFYIWPIIQTAGFSFTSFGVFGDVAFAGVENFTRLFSTPEFFLSLGNTLLYTAIVLLGVPIAVLLASLLNLPGLRLASLYRVLFFLPYVAMPTAIAFVWRIIFNGDFGLVNHLLGLIGIDGPYWISTPGFAIVAVAIVGLWSSIGFSMIVLAAGLKTIPPEYYEAASLDGASRWRQFRSITVPLLSPSIFFVTIITVIASFQLFDLLYAILGTTATNATLPRSMSLVYYFYQAGFVDNEKGYAAAVAMVIFVIIGVVTFLQFRFQRRWVHSD